MMEFDPADRDAFYRSLLMNPGERGGVDYKASVTFRRGDSLTLKLLRHILGMANSGGGWIVIGYLEDSTRGFIPDPEHSNAFGTSYDTTVLTNAVNSVVRRTDEMVKVYVNQVAHEDIGLQGANSTLRGH